MSYVVPVKSTVEILQNFVAFLEYMNFMNLRNLPFTKLFSNKFGTNASSNDLNNCTQKIHYRFWILEALKNSCIDIPVGSVRGFPES